MNIWAVVLAAGSSTRLRAQGHKDKKQFLRYASAPLYWHSVDKLCSSPLISGICVALPPSEFESRKEQAQKELLPSLAPGLPVEFVPGGALRQESVQNALQIIPEDCDLVLVHDAARPFFSPALVRDLAKGLETGSEDGIIPVLPCRDTAKTVRNGIVHSTLPREEISLVQTPQLFCRENLIQAHKTAAREGFTGTDDASLVERYGGRVKTIPGEEKNIKITTASDLRHLNAGEKDSLCHLTGFGYDVHKFGGTKQMLLGGIPIPNGPQVEAHSDGDVLMHALTDAVLSLSGQGDIGDHFPDHDPENRDRNSSVFLAEALHLAEQNRINLTHVDLTIITQTPRLTEYKPLIKKNLAGITGLSGQHINVKATTEEKLGFTGEKLGIKAVAVVSGKKRNQR
ncbi:MAG: 2-C-methyl-D-erythritol 4-phosphate cytidylyltransferase [Desulfonatronovibrionaceae bacterium]